jgi:single-strand DNA-binding protein
MDLNQVRVRGNLGKDPVFFEATNERAAMASFSLATNVRYRDRSGKEVERTEWHNIVLYDWCAEVARGYSVGTKVDVEGYLRTRKYESADGKGSVVEIVGRDIHEVKLPPRSERGDNAPAQPQQAGHPAEAEPNYH